MQEHFSLNRVWENLKTAVLRSADVCRVLWDEYADEYIVVYHISHCVFWFLDHLHTYRTNMNALHFYNMVCLFCHWEPNRSLTLDMKICSLNMAGRAGNNSRKSLQKMRWGMQNRLTCQAHHTISYAIKEDLICKQHANPIFVIWTITDVKSHIFALKKG